MKRSRFDEEQINRTLKDWSGSRNRSGASVSRDRRTGWGRRTFRDECRNETLFSSLSEARQRIGAWKGDYNSHRPHSSLGNPPPNEFATKLAPEKLAA